MNSSDDIQIKVQKTIDKFNMIQHGDSIVVGVSGGPDSMCLLHILLSMKNDFNLKLYAVHINHLLRGEEAERDETYTQNWCMSHDIPIFVRKIDVLKLSKQYGISVEETGRRVRYEQFNEILQLTGANKIAVAHNMNDNAETVLMRLIRGTGIEGLTGIEPVRGNIIRPIIELQREEIEQYCSVNNIDAVIDSSNVDVDFTRNKIRNLLIKQIREEINIGVIPVIARTAKLLREDAELLAELALEAYTKCVVKGDTQAKGLFFRKSEALSEAAELSLDLSMLNALSIPIKKRVIRHAIEKVRGNLIHIESKHIDDIVELIQKGKTGAIVFLPDNLRVTRSYGILHFSKCAKKNRKTGSFEMQLNIPGKTFVSEFGIEVVARLKAATGQCIEKGKDVGLENKYLHTIYFDYDKIKRPLLLRNRRQGDVFNPSGMCGTKTLKKFFIDEKIPRNERDSILLIATGNEVACIIGGRISEKFKCSEHTKNRLTIEVHNIKQ